MSVKDCTLPQHVRMISSGIPGEREAQVPAHLRQRRPSCFLSLGLRRDGLDVGPQTSERLQGASRGPRLNDGVPSTLVPSVEPRPGLLVCRGRCHGSTMKLVTASSIQLGNPRAAMNVIFGLVQARPPSAEWSLWDGQFDDGISVLNIADPTSPTLAGFIKDHTILDNCKGIVVR